MQIVNPKIQKPLLRGDVYIVKLDPTAGAEKGKTRPVLVVSNDLGNEYSPLTTVIPITSQKGIRKALPIMVPVLAGQGGLREDSYVDCGQIRTVDQMRLVEKVGHFDLDTMKLVDKALKISLALD